MPRGTLFIGNCFCFQPLALLLSLLGGGSRINKPQRKPMASLVPLVHASNNHSSLTPCGPLLLAASPFLLCDFMDQHLQPHSPALTEALAASSDTTGAQKLSLSCRSDELPWSYRVFLIPADTQLTEGQTECWQ